MIRELLATLADAMRYGDMAGHLRAWWSVATGEVRDSDRYVPVPEPENLEAQELAGEVCEVLALSDDS